MGSEIITLLTGLFVIVLIGYLFIPRKGFISKWKKASQNDKKAKIEDALKHLYNCEYNNTSCSLESISGALSLTRDETAKVIEKLHSMQLVKAAGDKIELTSEGRSYALRVIRIHRLWERYLADETSVNETEWHELAEEMEHIISPDEADQLAAMIGNPLLDPHGDPIPSSDGEIPVRRGIPISELNEGEFARIIHMEDEPSTIYSQLVAEGLYVGQQVKLIEKSDQRIKFEANGELCVLAPLFASYITVVGISDPKLAIKSFKKLSDLKVGQSGTVAGIAKAVRGQQRRRLLDLGVVPGSVVKAEIQSLSGDPTGYRIRGATIAIRRKQADNVFIKDVK